VFLSALLRQSLAKGQVCPEGTEKDQIPFSSLALPFVNLSMGQACKTLSANASEKNLFFRKGKCST
jgi:hypothetical protein